MWLFTSLALIAGIEDISNNLSVSLYNKFTLALKAGVSKITGLRLSTRLFARSFNSLELFNASFGDMEVY